MGDESMEVWIDVEVGSHTFILPYFHTLASLFRFQTFRRIRHRCFYRLETHGKHRNQYRDKTARANIHQVMEPGN